ncbi:MAG: type II toxin-antitoxin system RelE/ParE family toxin [Proteobacteria bacterium]|nr:type II toxin-antitoxin system RelE/ParE family toxin [Pseudomonadota bacterium]MBU1738952.1 type II toxin-antitoxin system RelE/ParE family toxin [Pseudomonadota bacterium]
MELQWTETAKNDLLSIRRYIAADNPTAAKERVERLRNKAGNIVHAPLAGRIVPELSRDDIREVIEGNYRIVYQLDSKQVSILTVFESHRLFPTKDVAEKI